MKILKCTEPTCNTHNEIDDRTVTFSKGKSVPVPETWTCDWHAQPNTAVRDHVAAVRATRPVRTAAGA